MAQVHRYSWFTWDAELPLNHFGMDRCLSNFSESHAGDSRVSASPTTIAFRSRHVRGVVVVLLRAMYEHDTRGT